MCEFNQMSMWKCIIRVNKRVREQEIPSVSTYVGEKEMIKIRQLKQKVRKM
jgi:hypothetical protein